MTDFSLEHYLERVEQQFQQISESLASGHADELVDYSAGLQQLSVDLVRILETHASFGTLTPGALKRMQDVVVRLPALRESLYRRSAHVDLALQILVPTASRAATYGAGGAKTGATIYGTIPRKSGAFQAISA